MSKALRTAALVVGAVALVATGIGALAAPAVGAIGTAGTFAGISAATFTAVGAVAGAVSAGLSLAAGLTAKKPTVSISGNQTKFTFSLDQGIPLGLGRTAIAGFGVHRQTWDYGGTTNNTFQTFFGVWSWGRCKGTNAVFQVDGTTIAFAPNPSLPGFPDEAQGAFHNWMWLRWQDGTQTDAVIATGFNQYPAGWSSSSKMSGYSDFAWTIKFDDKGKVYPGGAVPQPRRIDDWGPVYDPRQDSTYPGGSGPCRAGVESTYVFDGVDPAKPANRNPWLQALTWAIGHFANGKRILGIGMAMAAIDVPAYAEAANIADANGWTIGGVVFSTDGKYDVLKKMAAAGSGEPLQLGGMLSAMADTPRVSLATITDDDIIGRCTIPGSSRIKDRINGIIPTCRLEDHDWQLVPCTKVQVDSYVALDGRTRTKSVTYELVQDAHQAAELAVYDICNAREIDGIVLPLKLKWIGYKPGDAVTIASSTVAMDNQLTVIRRRHLDPSTSAVTLTLRTETTEKHAFALGKTTTPPPQPALQTVDRGQLLKPGIDAAWSSVADDNGKKPADGATNSADPNSPFGPDGDTVANILAARQQIEQDIDNLKQQTGGGGDTVPPGVPTGLATTGGTLTPDGMVDLTFTWTAGTEPDLDHYVLDVSLNGGGFIPFSAPGPVYAFHGITPNAAYQARVRAVDRFGNSSVYSATISGNAAKDTTKPSPPTGFAVVPQIKALNFSWSNSADTDLAGVRILGSADANFANAGGRGVQAVATPNVGGRYTLPEVTGAPFYYWAVSIDTSGNVSDPVGPIGPISSLLVNTSDLADQIITAVKVAPNAVYMDAIQAGAIVASKMALVGNNMFPDPQLQDAAWWQGAGSDQTANTWYMEDRTTTTAEKVANTSRVGSPGAWIIWDGATSASLTDAIKFSPFVGGVTPGKAYEFQGVLCNSGGSRASNFTLSMAIQWFKADYSYIPNADLLVGSAFNEINKLVKVQATAPAGAAFYRLYWNAHSNTNAAVQYGGLNSFGSVVVREAASATFVVDGAIIARHLTVDQAMVDKLFVNDLTVASSFAAKVIQSTDSLPGRLTIGTTGFTLDTAVADAQSASSGGNKIPYSGFETGASGPAWNPNAGILISPYYFTGVFQDRLFIKYESHGMTGRVGYFSVYSGKFPVQAGERLSFSARVEGQGIDQQFIRMHYYRTDGSEILARDFAFNGPLTFGTIIGGFDVVPAGTSTAIFELWGHTYGAEYVSIVLSEPMCGTASAAQTAFTPYSRGPVPDAAAAINANTTLIGPGKILLSGATTLVSLLYGPDQTKIDGGTIAANTLRINQAVIGLRGVQLLDITFDTNRVDTISWTAGWVEWQYANGTRRVDRMREGSQTIDPSNPVGVVYVWFDIAASPNAFGDGTGHLWAGMPAGGAAEIMGNTNNVILASYMGGTRMNDYYGRTIIDGDRIKTKTVYADTVLVDGSITTRTLGAGIVTADKIGVDKLSAIKADVGLLRTATSGARTEIEANQIRVYDSNNVLRVLMGQW